MLSKPSNPYKKAFSGDYLSPTHHSKISLAKWYNVLEAKEWTLNTKKIIWGCLGVNQNGQMPIYIQKGYWVKGQREKVNTQAP